MSLQRLIIRPVVGLFRRVWEAGEFFWSSPAFKRERSKAEPTRLEGPVRLERRETPNDPFGLLAHGLGLGQIAWMIPQPGLPVLEQQQAAPFRANTVAEELTRDSVGAETVVLSSGQDNSGTTEGPRQEEATTSTRPEDEGPYSLGNWANAVGAALDSRTAVADTEGQQPRNGGGGGGHHEPSALQIGTNSGSVAGSFRGQDNSNLGLASRASTGDTGQGETQEGSVTHGASGKAVQAPGFQVSGPATANSMSPPILSPDFGKSGFSFEKNVGQTDSSVAYLARGAGAAMFLTGNSIVIAFARPGEEGTRDVVRLSLVGATSTPEIVAEGLLASRGNYFKGNNPSDWLTEVPQYSTVRYRNVYDGIDLVFHSTSEGLPQFDFEVAAGADPSKVRMLWELNCRKNQGVSSGEKCPVLQGLDEFA